MKDTLESIRERAQAKPKRIILPESDEPRTREAIRIIADRRIAKVITVGAPDLAKNLRVRRPDEVEVVEAARHPSLEGLVAAYAQSMKHKGMTPDQARQAVLQEKLVFAGLMVRAGLADGFVAGASHTTADVVRSAIHCIGVDPAIGIISSSFLMEVPECPYGESGVLLFADCGVNPDPNPDHLAGIAISSARLFEQLVGKAAKVAFLSYSTKGSAKGPLVDKVVQAVQKTRARAPQIAIDGELQGDSALVPEVARLKCPGSPVAGTANVLIFPNLDAGNLAYKLVQRLAKARAVGPLLMGSAKPCSDLSRGCSPDDIVDATAITAVRA